MTEERKICYRRGRSGSECQDRWRKCSPPCHTSSRFCREVPAVGNRSPLARSPAENRRLHVRVFRSPGNGSPQKGHSKQLLLDECPVHGWCESYPLASSPDCPVGRSLNRPARIEKLGRVQAYTQWIAMRGSCKPLTLTLPRFLQLQLLCGSVNLVGFCSLWGRARHGEAWHGEARDTPS